MRVFDSLRVEGSGVRVQREKTLHYEELFGVTVLQLLVEVLQIFVELREVQSRWL